jgi:hypothetical protein
MKKIGLVGGIGPESTLDYYRLIIRAFQERKSADYIDDILVDDSALPSFRARPMGKPDHASDSSHYFFDAPDFTAFQADLNPMGVSRGFRQNVFHDPPSESSGALVLLQHDQDRLSWFDIFAGSAVHTFTSPILNPRGHSYHKPEKKITESHTHEVRTTPRTGMNAPAGKLPLTALSFSGKLRFQEPRNAGSRPDALFFNSRLTQGDARAGRHRGGG